LAKFWFSLETVHSDPKFHEDFRNPVNIDVSSMVEVLLDTSGTVPVENCMRMSVAALDGEGYCYLSHGEKMLKVMFDLCLTFFVLRTNSTPKLCVSKSLTTVV